MLAHCSIDAAMTIIFQALFVDGLGAATLSDPAHVTELDSSL